MGDLTLQMFHHTANVGYLRRDFLCNLCRIWVGSYSIGSMYGIFTYIYHQNQPFMLVNIPGLWILWPFAFMTSQPNETPTKNLNPTQRSQHEEACNGCISACGRASFWRCWFWLLGWLVFPVGDGHKPNGVEKKPLYSRWEMSLSINIEFRAWHIYISPKVWNIILAFWLKSMVHAESNI